MSESPQYEAFRAFARSHIELEVLKATNPLREEIRSLRTQLETRSAPQEIEGPPGKVGKDGRGISRIYIQPDGVLAVRYTDSIEEYSVGKVVGEKGERGEPGIGEKGERGADGKDARGIASVESREGRLLFRFTDNTEQDVGRIVGERGAPGERGKSLSVHNSSVAPVNPTVGDLWIVP